MSHIPQARAAHIRHANRAGGFGGLGGGFGTSFTFPSFTFPGAHTNTAQTGQTSISTPLAPPSSSVTSSSSLPVIPVPPSSTSSAAPLSTSSSTSSTTSTHSTTSLPVTTTASGTALHDNLTHYVSRTVSVTASSAASTSSTLPSTSNALVAPVIGGVAGGILGLAGLVFLITFCMRRRRKNEDAIDFDPGAFRRSAVPISDPPTHQDTIARGYNPPAMTERRPMYTGHSPYTPTDDAHSPTSGNPLVGNAVVFQAPFSPITSPGAQSPVSAYDHSWGAPAPVLTRNTSGSSAHQQFAGPAQYAQYPSAQYPSLPSPRNSQPNHLAPPQDYVDLERTSVTPFQAEQYVEISKQLNTEVPKGLDTPAVEEFVAEKMAFKDNNLPPLPPKDPFADAEAASAASHGEEEFSETTLGMVQDMSFPAPPSPVHATASRYRVESMPPTLPEIIVQSRVSVASTYLSEAGTPSASAFPSGQTVVMKSHGPFGESPLGSRFPVTPSPLASSFTVPTPPAATTTFPAEPAPAQARSDPKKRQTVYTVYDPEDAYGGI